MIDATLFFIAMTVSSGAMQLSALVNGHTQTDRSESHLSPNETCRAIARSISTASNVYNVGSVNYTKDINHWALSTTQNATCSFEPGTPEDVGIALQILGRTRTPFAVKGGGHSTNPGFSSTLGVQIAMSRFSDIDYDPEAQTVTIGAGLIWDDVYAALEPHGVNVVGGRVSGVGVAGFTLGGGYSWLTNQYGLTIDTVQAFELVAPNGTVMNVTQTSSPDLFFALKGGQNNFGIVTRFTLKTFPQTQVWGGIIFYNANSLDQFNRATADFSANCKDPKASLISSYGYQSGQPGIGAILFYDAPMPPSGVFDNFLAIPSVAKDVSTRSFSSLVKSPPIAPSGSRAIFNTVSVTGYPISLLESIFNQSAYWTRNLPGDVYLISYSVEPFLPTLFAHNTTPSAYPPDRTKGFLPFEMEFAWTSPDSDQAVFDAVRASARSLKADAIEGGQSDIAHAALYPNYAIFDTPTIELYGANLPRLHAIREAVDPNDVMGLAGGWKL